MKKRIEKSWKRKFKKKKKSLSLLPCVFPGNFEEKKEEEEEKKGSELPKRDNKDALLKSEEK